MKERRDESLYYEPTRNERERGIRIMLCEKCHQREAMIHGTRLQHGNIVGFEICHSCAKGLIIERIVMRDQRYPAEAYHFVLEAIRLARFLAGASSERKSYERGQERE